MKRFTLLLLMAFLGLNWAVAQSTIKGTVTAAEDGSAIPGATVAVKGFAGVGTITDFDGGFSINLPEGATTLVVTFVGYADKEVAVAGKNNITIALERTDIGLGEVIITGYSSRGKDKISSAVSTVTAEEMAELVPSTTIDNMLQGKAAGVDATALNGKPGNTATVKIRGAVSLNTTGGDKSQPLYVVDGIFLDEDDLNALNPNDIETMTVLKDAAAAAIYGSRGANGVVVITTKQGREGKARISISSRFGFGNKIKDPFDMMNAEQKIAYEEAIGDNTYTDAEKAQLLKYDHDWQDDILKQASIQSHSISATGGSKTSTYFLSFGYDQNTGIIEKLDGFERISGRLNMTSDLTSKLKVGTNISMAHTTSAEPRDRNNVQNPFRAMYDYNPYTPVYRHDANGELLLDDNNKPIYNLTSAGFPILEALEKNPEKDKHLRTIGSAFMQYNIIEGLSFKSQFSGSYVNLKSESYTQPGSVLDGYVGDPSAPGSKRDNGFDRFDYTWLNQVTYQKTIDKHNFDVVGFTEYFKGQWTSYRLNSKGYASPLLTTQENSSEATGATTSKEEYSLFSIAGAANYDWDGKYIASASVRRDGASRFGKDNKYGIFWSASLAWNIAKEDFLSSVEILDDLKLRVSYGTLGNWNIPNYASLGYYSFGAYNGQSAALINSIVGNSELTWESKVSTNIGLSSSFMENRFSAGIDYFIDKRDDFLFQNPLSWENGSYSQYTNAGEMTTTGLEFEANADIIRTSKLRWSVGANITFLDYEINKLNGQDQIVVASISVLEEGEEPFTFYLPRTAGVNPDNGNQLYLDKDGNQTETFSSGNAVKLSGKSPLPELFGGFRTSVSYMGIDLSADFSYKAGNYSYNYMAYNMLSDGDNSYYNQRVDAANFWKNPGDTGVLPKPNSNSNQVTDRFLQDASYLRFRNLTIGYSLPEAWIKAAKLTKVRVFAQAQNLYTWTSFEGDPEVSVGSGENQLGATQDFVPGLFTLYSYPAMRTFMFGVDIKF